MEVQFREILDTEKYEKMSGDASTREYGRFSLKGRSYIVCIENEKDVRANHCKFTEMQSLLKDNGCSVPEVLFYEDEYLIQEDFGDQSLGYYVTRYPKKRISIYKKAIDQIVKIQSISKTKASCFDRSFDDEKLNYEYSISREHFLSKYIGLNSDELKEMDDFISNLHQRIQKQKYVLNHRDYHSRNIHVFDSDKIGLIDFQDAMMGSPYYDLCSLLDDCYIRLTIEEKEELIAHYQGQANYVSFDLVEYTDVAIQRLLKALGSFCYLKNKYKKDQYIKHIGHAFENLRFYLELYQSKHGENHALQRMMCRFYEH